MSALDPYAMTLARARGRRLCKMRHADGTTQDYDRAKHLDLSTVEAPNLDALHLLLLDLLTRPDTCALRGAIADPERVHGVRRLLYPDPKAGDAATLLDVPRAWLALDLDGLPLPDGLDPHDLAACGRVARLALPNAFHGAACIIGATAGHGFKPGARLRLWCFLARPMMGVEIKRWLGKVPVDQALFSAAQAIYTAAPVFSGMRDPLPARLVRLDGAALVAPPSAAELPPPARKRVVASRSTTTTTKISTTTPAPRRPGYGAAALARAAVRIAAAPVDSRHATALAEAWSLGRLVVAGHLTDAEVQRVVDIALNRAGKPLGEGAAIGAWTVAHHTGGAA